MAQEEFWQRKIRAFLYHAPDRALQPHDEQQRSYTLIQQLLGSMPDQDNQQLLMHADLISYGLDLPPFITEAQEDVFLQEPTLQHPLTAESFNLRQRGPFKNLNLNSQGPKQLRQNAAQAIREAIKQLKNRYEAKLDRNCKLFMGLWRLLPKEIQLAEAELGGAKLGSLWELLPSDPRMPSFSYWEHQAMTSAVVTTYDGQSFKPTFLLFTIASAQGFVATSRRTQDLWMSSFLLSYLTWCAMEVIARTYGPDCIISPSLLGQPLVDLWLKEEGVLTQDDIDRLYGSRERFEEGLKVANFPNIFTAILPATEAIDKAQEAQRALKQAFKCIAEAVRAHVGYAITSDHKLEDKINKQLADSQGSELREHLKQRLKDLNAQWGSLWQRQIEDFLQTEIFWILYPWPHDANSACQQYEELFQPNTSKAYTQFQKLLNSVPEDRQNIGMAYQLLSNIAGRLLTTRKNLRQFQQVCEPEHKCSLCGLREALHLEWHSEKESEHGRELREFWELLSKVSGQDQSGRELKLMGRIRRGDRLCAICLTKRLAWEAYFVKEFELDNGRHHVLFPSTSTVATAKFKQRVLEAFLLEKPVTEKQALYKAVEEYVQALEMFLRPDDGAYDLLYYSASLPKLWELQKQIVRIWQDIGVSDRPKNQAQRTFERFLGLDGEWLYEESFDPDKIAREFQVAGEDLDRHEGERQRALAALDRLLTISREHKCGKPSKYYALIRMDGDHMGDWVAGRIPQEALDRLQRRDPPQEALRVRDMLHPIAAQKLEKKTEDLLELPRPLGPSIHLSISAALRDFALKVVPKVVEEEHCGKVIYAGGDDLLAFTPVGDLLSVLQKLREYFSNDFEQLNGTWCRLMGNLATTSAGAVIAHHTHPFSHAVEGSWDALKDHAKEKLERNAFAIHLIKRSGEPLPVGIHWYSLEDQAAPVLQYLQKLVKLFQEEGLADRLVYAVQEEAPTLQALTSLTGFGKQRLEWLVQRHAKESQRREAIDCATSLLSSLHSALARIQDKDLKDWLLLADLLRLARFIAQEG